MTPEECAHPPASQRARLLKVLQRPGLPAAEALARTMLARLDRETCRLRDTPMTTPSNVPYHSPYHSPYQSPDGLSGGQGREPDDLRDGAGALAWALGAALVLLGALFWYYAG